MHIINTTITLESYYFSYKLKANNLQLCVYSVLDLELHCLVEYTNISWMKANCESWNAKRLVTKESKIAFGFRSQKIIKDL